MWKKGGRREWKSKGNCSPLLTCRLMSRHSLNKGYLRSQKIFLFNYPSSYCRASYYMSQNIPLASLVIHPSCYFSQSECDEPKDQCIYQCCFSHRFKTASSSYNLWKKVNFIPARHGIRWKLIADNWDLTGSPEMQTKFIHASKFDLQHISRGNPFWKHYLLIKWYTWWFKNKLDWQVSIVLSSLKKSDFWTFPVKAIKMCFLKRRALAGQNIG